MDCCRTAEGIPKLVIVDCCRTAVGIPKLVQVIIGRDCCRTAGGIPKVVSRGDCCRTAVGIPYIRVKNPGFGLLPIRLLNLSYQFSSDFHLEYNVSVGFISCLIPVTSFA